MPVYAYAAAVRIIKAHQQVYKRRLAAACRADYGYPHARLDIQLKMLDKAFRLIIAEAYVVYIYPAFYGVKRALRVGAFLRLVYKLKYPCGAGKRVLVEFVSANPTGPMHIGNARGGAIGDTLSSLLTEAGYEVSREFYINDAGNQVAKFGKSLDLRYLHLCLRQ